MKPLTDAWRWSMRRSPIMLACRAVGERFRRHRRAQSLIEASGLSEPVQARITTIVSRTRLHTSEQGEIARELVAHAHDAADANKDESEILGALGDPPPVARLIRRAVKRRRPLVYQLRRWTARAALLALALMVVVYAALLVRYRAGAPSIDTDYYARINAPLRALPDSDKAWPAYREALIEWAQIRIRLAASSTVDPNDQNAKYRYPGADHIYDVPRDHPDYDETAEAFRAFRPTLDRAAQAALRPSLGLPYSDRTQRIPIEGTDRWIEEPIEPSADPAEQTTLFMALLPQLGSSRTIARLLAYDINLAIDEGDADRVVRDTRALLGLANQLQGQPTLISSLVAVAVQNLAMARLGVVFDTDPDLLSKAQLTELSHAIAASRDTTLDLRLEMERYAFQDLLQRIFTDNGRGGGRLTPEGVRLITESLEAPSDFGAIPARDSSWIFSAANSAAMPVVGAAVADRAQQSQVYDEIINAARRTLDAGPSSIETEFLPVHQHTQRLDDHQSAWYPLSSTVPAVGAAVQQVFLVRAATDQTLALLAAAAYRKDHDAWPETLETLVPAYLPAVPADPFDDTRLRYRPGPEGPRFWYAGADLDDDGGRATFDQRPGSFANARSLSRRFDPNATVPDADWVLFPPQD